MNRGTALLRQMGQELLANGKQPETAQLDALILLEHLSGTPRARLLAFGNELTVDQAVGDRYLEICRQRASGTNIAYLTGKKEFYGLDFEIGPGVLVPRPETEHLVEAALQHLAMLTSRTKTSSDPRPILCHDACTGSACIPVAIAHHSPQTLWTASDIDETALEWAKRNIAHHGMTDRIRVLTADLLDLDLTATHAAFDLITANPPYVAETYAPKIREMGWGEPDRALYAPEDGLYFIKRLVHQARPMLNPGGAILLEFGENQAEAVLDALRVEGYSSYTVCNDLAGLPRIAYAVVR